MKIKIGNKFVGDGMPFYTIAEIGSNFDNSITKAYKLIDLAKNAGADAVKFQSFTAETLVNDNCFKKLKIGYQSKWKKSVFEVYKKAEFPKKFHQKVFDYCKKKKVEFFSAPYDKVSVDYLDKLGVNVFKIGSGDLTWLENIEYIAKKNKPIILATGASNMIQISNAIKTIRKTGNNKIILMQCVTNYPASFNDINLKVLKMFRKKFNCLVGYSDHTPGDIVATGTVAMGGCMIEKHFTDNKKLPGPDHGFAMDPADFKEMTNKIQLMEKIIGKPIKKIYDEEKDQYFSMKRGIKSSQKLTKGQKLQRKHIKLLRPCLSNEISADNLKKIIGKKINTDLDANTAIKKKMIY
jgi:pseudaminic acid synthase